MEKKNNQTQISEYIRAATALGRRFEGQKSSAGVFQSSSPCPIPPSSANAKKQPENGATALNCPRGYVFSRELHIWKFTNVAAVISQE